MRNARIAVSTAAAASVLAFALALSGCAGIRAGGAPPASGQPTSGSPTSPSAPAESITGQWVLVSGRNGSQAVVPTATSVTLMINGSDSGGNGGCNAFGAVASGATTGAFTIRVGIHTDMACVGDDRDITEQQYFEALGRITTAALDGGQLKLSGGDVTLTFDRPGS